jgi:hypothetical protein
VRPCAEFEHGKHRVREFTVQLARPFFASHPRLFGRGPVRVGAVPLGQRLDFGDDFKLFAATFLAGFVFVSILIS